MEIERKYLINALPENLESYPWKKLTQAYISRDPVIRVRKSITPDGQASYRLCIKGSGLVSHEEYELDLNEQQFENLLAKTEGTVIEKTRYLVPLENGLTAELDLFEGRHKGIRIVEVEFPSEEEMNAFKAPSWFGQDVSDDIRYHNSEMSK